jgi:hypothetical protein
MQNAEIHLGVPKVAVQVDSSEVKVIAPTLVLATGDEVNLSAPALDLHVAAPSFAVSLWVVENEAPTIVVNVNWVFLF